MRWMLYLAIVATIAMGQPSADLLEQHRAHPDDWKVCHQIALAYTQAQSLRDAEAFYRKTLTLKPDFVPARKNLATVSWFLGKRTESEALFRALLPIIPNDPVPHLYIAMAESERRRFTAAKEHFAKAGDLAVRNPEALPAVVEAYLAAKDHTIVTVALNVVPELERTDAGLRTRVAGVFNRYQAWSATVKILEGVQSADLESMLLLAEAYSRQNLLERAHEIYRKAVEAHPADERSYASLAAFSSQHRNTQYALQVLEKGRRVLPASWRLQLHTGLLLALEGDRAAAERHFATAVEQSGGSNLPLFALGVLHLESGRTQDALTIFERAVQANKHDNNALYFRALALHRTGDESRRAEAESSVRTALEVAPDDAKSRVLLGQICLATGKLTAAVVEFKKALELEPRNSTALYQLALALRKQGQTAAADRYLGEFRKLKAETRESESELVQILKIIR